MEFKSTASIYEQIAGMLEDSILSGVLPEGERLPSVRNLAADVQVNPNTVQRTFQTLQDSDVIVNQRGIGYFVAEGARERILHYRRRLYVEDVLPEQFRQLALLGFSVEEISRLYADYLSNPASDHHTTASPNTPSA